MNPALSVLIASVNGPPMIRECLAALAPQRQRVGAEVIVIDACGPEIVRMLREEFPWAVVIPSAARRTIPHLRAIGLEHSRGDIVAVIEDHCIADPQWCEAIVAVHRDHPEAAAVGGLVENGSRRLIDWAVYFSEYLRYMGPRPRGPAADVPGNNVSYKRRAFDVLDGQRELLTQGFWETTLHGRLLAQGAILWLEPSVVVYHKKPFGFRYYLRQRFHYSRYYAGTAMRDASLPRRLVRTALSAALPPLLLGRMAAQVVRKRRFVREFLLSLPLLATFTLWWAVGEAVGCALGPGRSLGHIE